MVPGAGFGVGPGVNTTQNLAVGVATANFQVTVPSGGGTIRLTNSGPNVVFFAFGVDNTITAALATSVPILPNTVETFDCPGPNVFIAAIAGATGNTLYATYGQGS